MDGCDCNDKMLSSGDANISERCSKFVNESCEKVICSVYHPLHTLVLRVVEFPLQILVLHKAPHTSRSLEKVEVLEAPPCPFGPESLFLADASPPAKEKCSLKRESLHSARQADESHLFHHLLLVDNKLECSLEGDVYKRADLLIYELRCRLTVGLLCDGVLLKVEVKRNVAHSLVHAELNNLKKQIEMFTYRAKV